MFFKHVQILRDLDLLRGPVGPFGSLFDNLDPLWVSGWQSVDRPVFRLIYMEMSAYCHAMQEMDV